MCAPQGKGLWREWVTFGHLIQRNAGTMIKLLMWVVLGYVAYRFFLVPRRPLPPKEPDDRGGEYTDYEEVD